MNPDEPLPPVAKGCVCWLVTMTQTTQDMEYQCSAIGRKKIRKNASAAQWSIWMSSARVSKYGKN